MVFIMLTMTNVANGRISGFLCLPELNESSIEKKGEKKVGTLAIKNGNFKHSEKSEDIALTNCDVEVKAGEIVAVVGPVGCGKSSMVSALLGEMHSETAKVSKRLTKVVFLKEATLLMTITGEPWKISRKVFFAFNCQLRKLNGEIFSFFIGQPVTGDLFIGIFGLNFEKKNRISFFSSGNSSKL
jgi:energy-coupling factor transporter ATP-binding protein EcfA2